MIEFSDVDTLHIDSATVTLQANGVLVGATRAVQTETTLVVTGVVAPGGGQTIGGFQVRADGDTLIITAPRSSKISINGKTRAVHNWTGPVEPTKTLCLLNPQIKTIKLTGDAYLLVANAAHLASHLKIKAEGRGAAVLAPGTFDLVQLELAGQARVDFKHGWTDTLTCEASVLASVSQLNVREAARIEASGMAKVWVGVVDKDSVVCDRSGSAQISCAEVHDTKKRKKQEPGRSE